MTWADFYLVCFVVGIAFSLVSILGGGSRWHFHVPRFPHAHGSGSIAHAGHAGGRSGDGSHAGHISVFNFVTLTAFLAWFGGTGYLLTRYSSLWFLAGLGFSILSGLIGAAIIFQFLIRVLTSEDENLDPADFEMCGVLGRTSVLDSRRRHRRNYLLSGGNPAHVRGAIRKRKCDCEGNRSRSNPLREGYCIREIVERTLRRRISPG